MDNLGDRQWSLIQIFHMDSQVFTWAAGFIVEYWISVRNERGTTSPRTKKYNLFIMYIYRYRLYTSIPFNRGKNSKTFCVRDLLRFLYAKIGYGRPTRMRIW